MSTQGNRVYETFNLNFAAYLRMTGHKIVGRKYVGRRVKFIFDDSAANIEKIHEDFVMARVEGNIAKFVEAYNEVRALTTEAREIGF